MIMTLVALAAVVVGFVVGRSYERSRCKFIGKPLNTQEVLGVWKYDKSGKN